MVRFAADREKLEVLFDIYARINSDYADLKALLTQIIRIRHGADRGGGVLPHACQPGEQQAVLRDRPGPKGTEPQAVLREHGGRDRRVGGGEEHLPHRERRGRTTPRFYPEIAQKIGFPTTSILAVPMRVKDKARRGHRDHQQAGRKEVHGEEDLQWLEIFSTQAAIAVQNARSFQKVRNELSAFCRTRSRRTRAGIRSSGRAGSSRKSWRSPARPRKPTPRCSSWGRAASARSFLPSRSTWPAPGDHALHPRELRRHPRGAPGKRALRPREGRLHGRRRGPAGQVRACGRRHALPGRDRRHAPVPPGQAPAGDPEQDLRDGSAPANPCR